VQSKLLAYCEREQLSFTRGRAYKKNDQCFVEQKNGAIVRHFIGYDRYEGERAYRQLTEVYRALRLYVNFFQPSMKLVEKTREGSHVQRRYDAAQTPFQRLVASGVLPAAQQTRLTTLFEGLDPIRLLRQLERLQDALWQQAILPQAPVLPAPPQQETVTFNAKRCGLGGADELARLPEPSQEEQETTRSRRKYRHVAARGPRTYRTRPDPFAEVAAEIQQRLETTPELTARQLLSELQTRYPGQFPDGQLRTLQRRVSEWRSQALLSFNHRWLTEDGLQPSEPPTLRGESRWQTDTTEASPALAAD
jgi:hypothetical protein